MIRTWIFLLIGFALLASCSVWNDIGRRAASGAMVGVKNELSDEFLTNLINKIVVETRDSLLSQYTVERLDVMLDSVGRELERTSAEVSGQLIDTLLSEYVQLKIKKLIISTGGAITPVVGEIRDDLLGPKTEFLLGNIRDELLGDSTIQHIARIRNELLGDESRVLMDSLLHQALMRLSYDFKKEFKPEIIDIINKTEESGEKLFRNSIVFLVVLVISLGFIGFLARRVWNRSRILNILTDEINKIGPQDQYDDLVGRIKKQTISRGLEGTFQKILRSHGLYQQEEWKGLDKRLIDEITATGLTEKGYEELSEKIKDEKLKAHLRSAWLKNKGQEKDNS